MPTVTFRPNRHGGYWIVKGRRTTTYVAEAHRVWWTWLKAVLRG